MLAALALAVVAPLGPLPRAQADETTEEPANPDIEIELQILKNPEDRSPEALADDDSWRLTNETELAEYFNSAHCDCDFPIRFRFTRGALVVDDANRQRNVELWFGPRCNEVSNVADRDARCEQLTTTPDGNPASDSVIPVSSFDPQIDDIVRVVSIADIMFPNSAGCGTSETTTTIWALLDNDGDGVYDSESSKDYNIDTQPPPAPPMREALGSAEDAVALRWTVPTERKEDVREYQVLCATRGEPVFETPPSEPVYELPDCEVSVTPPMPDGGLPDAGAVFDAGADADPLAPDAAQPPDAAPPPPDATMLDGGVPSSLLSLDPRFICSSGTITSSASSYRVNLPAGYDQPVDVVLVVIDDHLNPLAISMGQATPAPVQDFWETYGNEGGDAFGGYCFVATAAYGDYDHPFVRVLRDFRDGTLARFAAGRAFIRWYYTNSPALADFIRRHPSYQVDAQLLLWPVVLAAGAWEYTGAGDKLILLSLLAFLLLRRRTRAASVLPPRARKLATAIAAVIVLLVAGLRSASAQIVYDDDYETELDVTPLPQWTFELKFGPYTPDIDGERGLPGPGPYERTFGDCGSNNTMCNGGTDALMTQVEIDRYFLYPRGQLGVAVGLGYMSNTARAFAQGTDGLPNFGVRAPNDDTSFYLIPIFVGAVYRFTWLAEDTYVPLVPYGKLGLAYGLWWITKGNGNVTTSASNGDAKGGTLGWQAVLGLEIRADRIDPSATRNLQTELGVEHAGFFAEATYADISGFGMDHKLRVGDLTWSLGVVFEF